MTYDTELGWSCSTPYYVKTTTQRLSTQSHQFYKTFEGGCIAVLYHYNGYYGPILISTVQDYVKYSYNGNPTGSYVKDGVTWYVSTSNYWNGGQGDPTIPVFEAEKGTDNYEYIVESLLKIANWHNGDFTGKQQYVSETYAKVNGVWQDLLGTDIDDIRT